MMERYKMKPTANIGLDDCEMYPVGNKGGMRMLYTIIKLKQ